MSLVEFSQNGHIGTLTLNDPERLNAMSENMAKEFKLLVAKLKKEKTLRVLILTGAGRAFSSGGDLEMLKRMSRQSKALTQKQLMAFYKSFLCVKDLPQPLIAQVNGHAIGAGFCLVLACDLRFAADNAKMGANFAKLGISPGMGGTYNITRLAGLTSAAEIMYTGSIYDSRAIEGFGLLNGVFTPEDLSNKVAGIAQTIAANSPQAVQGIKRELAVVLHRTAEQMFVLDAKSQSICLAGPEAKEGLKAVEERRVPKF